MKNGERTINKLIKNGSKNILIHSLYGTTNWIVSEKTEENLWKITLFNPTKNITYNIGTTNNKQHKKVWSTLTTYETEKITNQIKIAQELKALIKNYKNKKGGGEYIRIKIPNSKYYLEGLQQPDYTWKTWVSSPKGEKVIIKKPMETDTFILLSELILKTPWPKNSKDIKNFINNIIKSITKHATNHHTNTVRKSQASKNNCRKRNPHENASLLPK